MEATTGWFRNKNKRPKTPESVSGPTLEPEAESTEPELSEDIETDADFNLDVLLGALERRLPQFLQQPIDRELTQARLADAYRDSDIAPVSTDHFETACHDLDEEGWRRLALLVDMLDEEDCRESLGDLIDGDGPEGQVTAAFAEFANDTALLTLATLRHSDLRREEFVRRWVMRLGAGIEGENVATSLARLDRLDYGKLLTEAERARQLAQERTAYLTKLKQIEDARNPRGKW